MSSFPCQPTPSRFSPRRGVLAALAVGACLAVLAVTTTGAAQATEGSGAPLPSLLTHYEAIRQQLLGDSLDGVADHVAAIRRDFDRLEATFDAETAEVDPERVYSARKLLPEIGAAVAKLESARGLEPTRDAFYELSKVLIRYRYLSIGEWPAVAYCPMAKRSWLQPQGEIGNPYYGPSMPKCGSLIEDRQTSQF